MDNVALFPLNITIKLRISLFFFIFLCVEIPAQTHSSVALENQVYYILEQAETRGLCGTLPSARPYTRFTILKAINEILESESSQKVTENERIILKNYQDKFAKPDTGLTLKTGSYYGETTIGSSDVKITGDIRVSAYTEFSNNLNANMQDYHWGTENWASLFFNGDIGEKFSYQLLNEFGIMKAPCTYLGTGYVYYKDFDGYTNWTNREKENPEMPVYTEPLTHFPYSYKKRWDGSVFSTNDASYFKSWPNSISYAFALQSEMAASFIDNKLFFRFGRIPHEWGSESGGSSILFNRMARPFIAFEGDFIPNSWFEISSLTGCLEYFNSAGITESAWTFQNAFSVTMFRLNYKNYLFFDAAEAAIWLKRFELGYLSPITSSFFYQNNSGDFDNLAIYLNLKGQVPGVGTLWGSIFIDEAYFLDANNRPTLEIFHLDRTMLSWQVGTTAPLPFFSFSSLKITYSRVRPYCYTHQKVDMPFSTKMMEQAFINNGVCLGYSIPPNSDELLIQIKTMPVKNMTTSFQYQMIRHGADYGSSQVDGSSLLSELDPVGRSSKPELKSYFLQDGAYQWMHIFKINNEWALSSIPLTFFFEGGVILSYFTNIDAEANKTGKPHPYKIIDTAEYPKSTNIIVSLGIKLFPGISP
ncbi:MAG: hypothetical protein LBD07_04165 [Spirochaetaceae bacterium]|jgi:hypothetical protein|nr:hypothetical protein [Spirochaetaceae bacterium]